MTTFCMTTFCSIPLSTCLMNASGCRCSTVEQINKLDNNKSCGAIVSKSCTVLPQDGNPQPRLYINDTKCINSMGLPNFGHKYYSNILTNKLYIQSIYPHNLEELDTLFDTKSKVIEVNLSCPNVMSKHKFDTYEMYLNKIYKIKGDKIIGIKLPPVFNLDDYHVFSTLLLKYEINYIVCCNTIPNCLIINYKSEHVMLKPNNGLGGMSFKEISLANVYNFHKLLGDKIDIVGCGGINNGSDVFEYILCGAKCVQLGSCLIRDDKCFERIEKELNDIMVMKGYTGLDNFFGKIRVWGEGAKL